MNWELRYGMTSCLPLHVCYPTNDKSLASVDAEVLQQVRRLQHYPSIAFWADILSFATIYINSFRSLLKLRLNLKKIIFNSKFFTLMNKEITRMKWQ